MTQIGEPSSSANDAKTEKIKFFFLKTVSVEFKSDHALILDNRDSYDKTGGRYPKPEWKIEKPNERTPITHSKEKTLELDAEFLAKADAKKSGKITGKHPLFELASTGSTSFDPGKKVKVSFKSTKPLPNVIKKERVNIAWDVTIAGEHSIVNPSGQHTFFITWSDPIDKGYPEDGVTHRRMNKAIDWVGSAWSSGKRKPVEVVDVLFGKYKGYVLGLEFLPRSQQQYLAKNPDLLIAMKMAGFPTYMKPEVGGAWSLSQSSYQSFGGECQAIARLIRGIIHQLGMPGEAEVKYVNANASDPYKAVVSDSGTKCAGPRPDHLYALVDSPVQEGKTYANDGTIGWNNYEAYLKYTHGKEYWYGGGIGRLPDGHDPLKVFYGLVEFKPTFDAKTRKYLRQVTKVWSY